MSNATLSYEEIKNDQIQDAATQIEFLVARIVAVANAAIESDAKRDGAGEGDCQTFWLLDTIIGAAEQVRDLSYHIRGF